MGRMNCVSLLDTLLFIASHTATELHLRNYVKANPSKSTYGFTLNRKRPGHFHLCFLANASASIQTWVSCACFLVLLSSIELRVYSRCAWHLRPTTCLRRRPWVSQSFVMLSKFGVYFVGHLSET